MPVDSAENQRGMVWVRAWNAKGLAVAPCVRVLRLSEFACGASFPHLESTAGRKTPTCPAGPLVKPVQSAALVVHHWGRAGCRLYGSLLQGALSLALACGSAPPVDVGIDYAPQDVDRIPEVQGASLGNGSTSLPQFVQPDAPPLCQDQFVACGGLLAGTWEVMETCNKETRNRKALQLWGQAVMNLDMGACGGAVERVQSSWAGDLVFDQGVAMDRRLRSDLVEMTLTRECLNATFNITIKAERIASVCSNLTTEMRNCSSVGSACKCSSRRENESDTAGVYGVLGKSVSIATASGGHDVFDYCVDGDLLLWREPGAARHVVLRLRGPNTAPFDPEGVR